MNRKMTKSDYILETSLVVLVTIITFICLVPFIHVLAMSLSRSDAITSGSVFLVPIGINFEAYVRIFQDVLMMNSLWFSIYLTLAQVAFSLVFTTCLAYPLSRPNFKWKKQVTIFVLITMYVNPGTIPAYLLIQYTGLLDTVWALLLPGIISVYNLLVMRSFFQTIPESLVESIKIDGGSEIRALVSIVLPLSKPVLATMALFYGVARWNKYSDVLYYIQDPDMMTLQTRLQQIISQNQITEDLEELAQNAGSLVETEALKSACLIFATIPILVMYPFLQKYFVKGMTLGAVKE